MRGGSSSFAFDSLRFQVPALPAVLVAGIDNHPVFPDVCTEAQNGFLGSEKCFAGSGPTKHGCKNTNDSKRRHDSLRPTQMSLLAICMGHLR
jgi:hypothetical protein